MDVNSGISKGVGAARNDFLLQKYLPLLHILQILFEWLSIPFRALYQMSHFQRNPFQATVHSVIVGILKLIHIFPYISSGCRCFCYFGCSFACQGPLSSLSELYSVDDGSGAEDVNGGGVPPGGFGNLSPCFGLNNSHRFYLISKSKREKNKIWRYIH